MSNLTEAFAELVSAPPYAPPSVSPVAFAGFYSVVFRVIPNPLAIQPVVVGHVCVKCSSPTSSVNFSNKLTASVFVSQTTSDICSYFKDHMPGWQGESLKDIILPVGFILVQYVDDLLFASRTYKDCLKDAICLCTALAEKGHHTSLSKLPLCQQKVKYLELILTEGQRLIDPEQVQTIVEMP